MQQIGDNVTNWYLNMPKQFKSTIVKDPTYKNHLIKLNSMCLVIGKTGSGKTNSIVDFLHRSNGRYYKIIIFTGSNKDEPLYKYLEDSVVGIELIDDIKNIPTLEALKGEDKSLPKLIIWDDSIFLDKKLLREIEKFYMASRKSGWTNFFLSQNYISCPIFIRRNISYLMLFKICDTKDLKNILKTVSGDVDIHKLLAMMKYCTEQPLNFLTIAVNDPINTKYRHNFTNILNPNDF